jgi:membrane protease YdiL (CAAX protease family)
LTEGQNHAAAGKLLQGDRASNGLVSSTAAERLSRRTFREKKRDAASPRAKMPAVTDETDPSSAKNDLVVSSPKRAFLTGAAWLVGTAAVVRLGELVVGRSPLGAALVGAVLVDLVTYRAGVRWDGHEDGLVAGRARLVRGVLVGLAVSAVLVVVPLVASFLLLGASLQLGSPSASIGFALLRALAVASRDELLLRGLPLLIAKRAGIDLRWAILFGGLASVASLLLAPGSSVAALVLVAAQGLLYGVLFMRTGAAFAPVAAHAGWILFSGIALRGGLLEVVWGSGMLADGMRARGLPALVAAVVTVVAAAVFFKNQRLTDIPAASSPLSTKK